MSKILLIETSTSLCSVALASSGDCCDAAAPGGGFHPEGAGWQIVAERRSNEPRQHASLTAVFIGEVLREAGLNPGSLRDAGLSAVALSAGPGSYTGLRVGSSSAKGICFGAGVPLISVGTLDVLAWQGLSLLTSSQHLTAPSAAAGQAPASLDSLTILPMIDARRSEVYTAPYRVKLGEAGDYVPFRVGEVAPVILDAGSFSDLFAAGPVLIIGDGAAKFADMLGAEALPAALCSGTLPAAPVAELADRPTAVRRSEGGRFVQCCPEARAMLQPALAKFRAGQFEDIAYFEPFYLKDFVATVGKKLF